MHAVDQVIFFFFPYFKAPGKEEKKTVELSRASPKAVSVPAEVSPF